MSEELRSITITVEVDTNKQTYTLAGIAESAEDALVQINDFLADYRAVVAADPADTTDWTEADYARRVAARDFPRPVASPDDTTR
jgi:hypothetical protein